jgi:hypothetical protein
LISFGVNTVTGNMVTDSPNVTDTEQERATVNRRGGSASGVSGPSRADIGPALVPTSAI